MKVKVYPKWMGNHLRKVKRAYPECRYRFLMKLKHVSTTKNFGIFPRQLRLTTGKEVKYVCLMFHPIQVQKGQAYWKQRLLRLTMKAGCLSSIWIHMLRSMCKMNRLKTILRFLLCSKIEKFHINPN